ncbi:MAG TPA: ATP-binding cassette domain-containing protein [Vicinamibacterales bacterium]|nr:ATP-binding cassette domain-containing protein [Vicinamibacterales bacterium]
MSALEFDRVVKDYRGLRPLRVASLSVAIGERVALAGLDAPAAETFVNLATGSGLPDEGEVRVLGQATSAITDGDDWLASLDRFGIVSHRAVLLEGVTVAQNIALSFSLSIEPIPHEIYAKVEALADAVGIERGDLERAAAAVSAATRVRAHVARALALDPQVLVLEHPTLYVDRADAPSLGASIARAVEGRALAVLALTDDEALAKGMDGRRLRLNASTGVVKKWGQTQFLRWTKK